MVPLVVAACGGGNGGAIPAIADAGSDVAPETGAFDSGDCFPFCASGDDGPSAVEAGGDGAESCLQLQAAYESYELTAQACDPQLPGQCASTASDPCCPVTVGSDPSAIDDFSLAVSRYVAECPPNCSIRHCQPAPSDQCAATGTGTGPTGGLCM